LHTYYDKEPVAVETLGAASWFSEGKKMDIVGLGMLQSPEASDKTIIR
jgi:hypothetical protein